MKSFFAAVAVLILTVGSAFAATAPSVTIHTNQSLPVSAQQVLGGVPVVPPAVGYSAPVWTLSDPSMGSFSSVTGNFFPSGTLGTVTITATSSKSGSPDLIGTVAVTVVGPIPDGLLIVTGTPTP